jgi:hypothetical protein
MKPSNLFLCIIQTRAARMSKKQKSKEETDTSKECPALPQATVDKIVKRGVRYFFSCPLTTQIKGNLSKESKEVFERAGRVWIQYLTH